MLVDLIQRYSLCGLGKDIDLLKDRHALAFHRMAKAAWLTAIRGINKQKIEIRKSVMQILGSPCKWAARLSDVRVVAHTVVSFCSKVLGLKTSCPFSVSVGQLSVSLSGR